MLTIFKRHTKACKETHAENGIPQDKGRDFRKCSCPLHTEGTLGSEMIRRALNTANWTRAQAIVREKESLGRWDEPVAISKPLIADCARTFLASLTAVSAGRAQGTIRGIRSCIEGAEPTYRAKATGRKINDGLLEYCEHKGYTLLEQLTLPVLTQWADTWDCGPLHRAKRIQLLRRFFKFAIASKWTTDNPALAMEYPKGKALKDRQKLPFDQSHLPQEGPEMSTILAYASTHGPKLYALTCLMRYGGLRISDATTFNSSRVMADGSIFLRMTKTNGIVSVPMHPKIKYALSQLTPDSSGNYFHSGECKTNTAADNWRVRFVRMFSALGMTGAHPHRFRHTFAVDLLLRGMPIDQVSTVMGHHSVKITEKHYLAFVAARRTQLRDSMLAAWGMDTTPAPVTPTTTLAIVPRPSQGVQEVA